MKCSWKQVKQGVERIAAWANGKKFVAIYGVPRGGLIPAVMLSHLLGIPLRFKPAKNVLVLDEVADSGKQLSKYKKYYTACLYKKRRAEFNPSFAAFTVGAEWIEFPWELQRKHRQSTPEVV